MEGLASHLCQGQAWSNRRETAADASADSTLALHLRLSLAVTICTSTLHLPIACH